MEATGNCKIGECALERSHWLRVAEGSLCKKAYIEWKKKTTFRNYCNNLNNSDLEKGGCSGVVRSGCIQKIL